MSKRKTGRIILYIVGGVFLLLALTCGGGLLLVRNALTSFSTHESKMCLQDDLDIRESDLWFSPGMDSVMWCRLVVKADSIDDVFDHRRLGTVELDETDVQPSAIADPGWWDVADYTLTGGDLELAPNQEYMEVGYADQGDGTLIVFLLWYTV